VKGATVQRLWRGLLRRAGIMTFTDYYVLREGLVSHEEHKEFHENRDKALAAYIAHRNDTRPDVR
jgi:hypothetical protein